MSEKLESLLDKERRADCARNDQPDPSKVEHWKNPLWRYRRSDETDVAATWRRWGWSPVFRGAR